eukprot:1137726-Pelagomonas_calceolata.AAC.5
MLAASHAVACLVLAAPPQRVLDILSAMLPPSPPLANSHPHSQPSSNPQGGIQPGLVQNALDAEDRGECALRVCAVLVVMRVEQLFMGMEVFANACCTGVVVWVE